MREKLLDLMKNEGLKPSQLAELLEINPAGISHILAGRNKPGFDLLQKILRRFPRINPDWLLLDSDKMYRDEAIATPAKSSSQTPSSSGNDLFTAEPAGDFPTDRKISEKGNSQDNATHPILPGQLLDSAGVKRIIVLYDDQTFESFTPTKR